jgi:hypothetical protein
MARSAHPDGEKHHYLPVFYLKQWAGKDGRLCEFSRPYKNVKPKMVSPEGTGYKRGLNTFPSLDSDAADFLEGQFFLQADDLAARALELFLGDGAELTAQMRDAWSRFLMTLLHRTPEGVARIKTQVLRNIKKMVEPLHLRYHEIQKKEGYPSTFDEFKEIVMTEVGEHATMVTLRTVMDSERVGTLLNSFEWRALSAHNAAHKFLTSDRPLIMTDGLGQPEAYLMLPISPERVFMATRSRDLVREIETRMTPNRLIEFVNDRVARQARTFVYGTTDAARDFVEGRLGGKAWWSPLRH